MTHLKELIKYLEAAFEVDRPHSLLQPSHRRLLIGALKSLHRDLANAKLGG